MILPQDYGALRAFVTVADAKGFGRAAERLGVSSSAVSQMVRGLENRLDIRLLNRTTRSISLTDAGTALLTRVRPLFEELGDIVTQTRDGGRRISGRVRIHAFRIAAEQLLVPMLDAFGKAYPSVVLDITLDDQLIDIVAEGYDFALRIGEVIDQDMIAVPLGGPLRQIAVASPYYLERAGTPATPRDLVDHNCIRWRWPGQDALHTWEFFEAGRWFTVSVTGSLIVNSRPFAVQAAAEGVGIAFAIAQAAEPYVADGRLTPLLTSWAEPFPGFYLCYPSRDHMASASRAFIDAICNGSPQR